MDGIFRAASVLIVKIIYVFLALQVLVGTTSGFPTTGPGTYCNDGQVWDVALEACVSCSICQRFPETPVCEFCPETATSRGNAVTQTPPCEDSDSVWDAFQKACVSCRICETHPDTPICGECGNRQAGSPMCPTGHAWDSFLDNCISCTVCDTHPDTEICRVCPTVAPTGPPNDDPGRLTVILAAVTAFLCVFIVVLVAFFLAKYCVPARYLQCCKKEPRGGETNNGKRITQPMGQEDSGQSSMVSSRSNSDTCVMEPLQPNNVI